MRKLVWALIIGAAVVLPAAAQQKVTISIATGPTGGVYYPMGGGMANVLTKYVPNLNATAESTAGSIANLEFILTKKADVALSMADASYDAYKGEQYFRKCDHQSVQSVLILESKPDSQVKQKNDVFNIAAVDAGEESRLRSCKELGHA